MQSSIKAHKSRLVLFYENHRKELLVANNSKRKNIFKYTTYFKVISSVRLQVHGILFQMHRETLTVFAFYKCMLGK